MRFLLDENLPAWLAPDLRARGLDVQDVRELGRPGLPDEAVYALALRERRHLVSANYKDFGNPLLFPPTRSTGILIVRMPKCSVRETAAHILRFLTSVKPADLAGCLIVLETTRLRRRPWEI